ncbi:MAG: hypothetical protein WCP10_04425 [Desulfuromonadales bacterium]
MEDVSYKLISRIGKTNLIPISVTEIETAEIRSAKKYLTHGQYCAIWQPLICLHILDEYNVDLITYVDADIMFFYDPEVLFEELNNCSASVVSHNYTPAFDNTPIAGKFCVQFNAFRNNMKSREVLNYWKACCFKYSKWMPSNYPGQLSLDYWPELFEGVRVIQHSGAGVAPWNIQKFKVTNDDGKILVNGYPIVFYHFHEYAWDSNGHPFLSRYPLSAAAVELIYQPYTSVLREIQEWVKSIDNTFYCKKVVQIQNLRERFVSYFLCLVSRCYREILRQKLKKLRST